MRLGDGCCFVCMTAKIESQSEDLAEQERVKRDLYAQVDDRDFRLSEMEKQLDIAAAKYKDLEAELHSLLQVPSFQVIYVSMAAGVRANVLH